MSKKVGWGFWWLWLIANIIGSAILPVLVWQEPYDLKARIFLNEILQSIGISVAQSLVLRDRFAKEGWWLPLTLFGWLTGLTIVFFMPSLAINSSSPTQPIIPILLMNLAIVGTVVSICQWQLLKCFRAAGLWLFASVFALSMSGLGLYLGYMVKSVALASVLQGAIYGSVTGLAVIKILRSPKIFPKKSQK
ncbi:hypothetical protein H6F42_04555 [Pseudanabaena sp. FACHB-1998]|uniref:hypothetical protein n=1 Tax=Pseudanabaena sp. FACHB-1998 TaxID=2692858 RepID=UPI001680828D|nr:hypothetical protein [Pseudanabaena sp. FACHB-1998]MBD2176189.1 hypothetical protein [Pseudanabaena sp. FACHB-1998]